MSVINQMLQDLEQRRYRAGAAQGALSDLIWPGAGDSAAQWRIKALVWALTLLIAVLAGVLLWNYLNTPTSVAAPTQTAVQLPPIPASPPVLPAVTPVQNQSAASSPLSVNEPEPVAEGEPVPEIKVTEPEDNGIANQHAQAGIEEPATDEVNSQIAIPTDGARIRAVRLSATPAITRVVFDLSAAPRYRVSAANPRQLIIELDDTSLTQPLAAPDLGGSLLSGFRAEAHADKVRIELDLKRPVRTKSYPLPPEQNYGQRLVLDLYPEDGSPASGEAIAQPEDAPATDETAAPALAAASPTGDATGKKLHTQTPEQQAELAYQEGVTLIRAGQFSAAAGQLHTALRQNPQYTQAREALAGLMINNKRLSEAEGLLAEGIVLNPQYMPLTKLYARVLVAQDRTEAAVQALEKITPEAAQDPDYYAFLAALYQRLERHTQAISAYRTALKIQPQQGLWWMGLGISLEATNEPSAALDAYRHALASQNLPGAPLDYVKERLAALKLQDN